MRVPPSRPGVLFQLLATLLLVAATADSGPTAQLVLEIAAAGGGTIAAPYVAVVPEDQPLRNPLREEVLDSSSPTVSFTVIPGKYRIVCGAPGYETVSLPTLDLPAGREVRQGISLRPLGLLRGRVLDEDGQPVGAARVGHWSAFLDRSLRDFGALPTELGERHLRKNFETITSPEGTFELPALPGFRHLIWIEAPGFAPGVLNDVLLRPPSEAGPWEVRLARGASLQVEWEAGNAAEREGQRLVLRPAKVAPGPTSSLALSLGLWDRSLAGGKANWVSVAAGNYQIWLHQPRRGPHQDPPVLLAAPTLRPGLTERLRLEVPRLDGAAPGPEAQVLRLLIPGVSRQEFEGLKVWQWVDDKRVPQIFEVRGASGGTRLDLVAACRRGARYQVTSPQRVSPSAEVESSSCSEAMSLVLHSFATAEGMLEAPQGESLPRSGVARVERCTKAAEERGEPLGAFPFTIEQRGRFEVKIPAGCVTASLEVSDFAPLPLAPLELAAGSRSSLGVRALQPGGAIAARIVAGADGRPLDGVTVTAVPAPELPGALAMASARQSYQGTREGITARGGWIRLYGLPAGDYFLQLRSAGQRWPQFAGPFGVEARDESFFDEVVYAQPASVEMHLEPGPALARLAESFRVEAQALSPNVPRAAGMRLSAERMSGKSFSLREIPPGTWELFVVAAMPGGESVPVHQERIEVPPGAGLTVPLRFEGEIFLGTVTYLAEPVDGTLTLTPVPLDGRRRLTALLENGEFQVLLERPGAYEARVADRSGRFSGAIVPRVEFVDPGEEVRIEVPAGRVAGRVTDPEGQPVAGATVEARSLRPQDTEDTGGAQFLRLSARTGLDGAFLLEGVAEGDWAVSARKESRASAPRSIQIHADQLIQGIDLQIQNDRVATGTVLDELGQPLNGVKGIVSFAPLVFGDLERDESWTTSEGGRFSFSAGEHYGTDANAALVHPSGTVTAMRSRVGADMVLVLPSAGGEASIEFAGAGWKDDPPPLGFFLVRDDGSFLSTQMAAGDARVIADGESTRLVFPRLGAGRWHMVRLRSPADMLALLAGAGKQIPALVSFEVVAGQSVVAEVSSPKGGSR